MNLNRQYTSSAANPAKRAAIAQGRNRCGKILASVLNPNAAAVPMGMRAGKK